MKAKLIADLLDAHSEIERVDPSENPDADHPAYVLTFLTAALLRQRQGEDRPMDRDDLIAVIALSCRSILAVFMNNGLPPDQMIMVRDAYAALEPLRPRHLAEPAA